MSVPLVRLAVVAAMHCTRATNESYTPEQFKQLLEKKHRFSSPVTVTGHLDLYFIDLGLLPPCLTILGNLYLQYATNSSLPPKLHVTGYFYLMDAQAVTSIPEDLVVGRDVDVYNCPKLGSLPSWIECLGYTSDGGIRSVRIDKTAIPEADLRRLREAKREGVALHV